MINKIRAIQIAKDFLNTELEKEDWFVNVKPFIKAFVLYGSVAKGTNTPESDIDILLILPLEQEKKYTIGEYFYNYNNFKVNIVLRSIEKLRKIASEKKDLLQKEIFRKAEVLMDVDGEVSGLLKEIEKI
ncbi:MAG: nucleotidyltransferase domain-containing protein [bacterium]|nr:nucleotidyltransferase domain-containing protein [bacterium]